MPGWPLRCTVDKSSGSARRALSGIAWLLPDGGPFKVPGAVCFSIILGLPGVIIAGSDGDPVRGHTAVIVVVGIAAATAVAPPILGGTTMMTAMGAQARFSV
jgi:hypothetical protein